MGAAPSKPAASAPAPSSTEYDEKLSGRLAQLSLASGAPLAADGSLQMSHMDKWESADQADARIRLSRTVLSQTNIRDALVSRATRIADPHVFNTETDFKTSPVTNQKCVIDSLRTRPEF
jgi:bleomycin hydrolase